EGSRLRRARSVPRLQRELRGETMAETVTAGRDMLGDFAPTFAALNDDVLFGQVWSREAQLSQRDRSVVTVTAVMASGVLDSALQVHISAPRTTVSPPRR